MRSKEKGWTPSGGPPFAVRDASVFELLQLQPVGLVTIGALGLDRIVGDLQAGDILVRALAVEVPLGGVGSLGFETAFFLPCLRGGAVSRVDHIFLGICLK